MSLSTIRAEDIPADMTAREFLRNLDLSHGKVMLEDGGKLRVILTPPHDHEMRRQAMERLFGHIERTQAQFPDGDSDQLLEELEAENANRRPASAR